MASAGNSLPRRPARRWRIVAEAAYLPIAQGPGVAGAEAVEPDGPNSNPHEAFDRGADRAEHPPELALPALGEDGAIPDERGIHRRVEEADDGVRICRRREPERGVERGKPFIELDAAAKGAFLVAIQGPRHRDGVLALDAVSRMEDVLGPVAVVRQEQEALAVEVEAADRIKARAVGHERGRQQVQHGRRRMPVADR